MRRIAFSLLPGLALLLLAQTPGPSVHLNLRSRVQPFKGTADWQEVSIDRQIQPRRTALVLCDMWDHHWCKGAEDRVATLAAKMAPVVDRLRAHGVLIIHAPSETMEFYKDHPARLAMLKIPLVDPPQPQELNAPPLPIDDSDGGCDTPGETEHRAWTCQHPGLKIAPEDYISDNGREIYNLLRSRSIQTVFYTGVHANMCILNRTFAIKQMMKWGVNCVLLRDLTDAMYNPASAPHVTHQTGTGLVIEYIEKYWAPSAVSNDLLDALK